WVPYKDEWQSYLSPEVIEAIAQVTPQDVEIREQEVAPAPSTNEPVLLTMKESKEDEVNAVLEGISSRNEINNEMIYADDATASPKFNHENRSLISVGATTYWNKNRSSKKGFYLLHNKLPVNTMIQITNPVTNKTVLAKVVGEIPDNIYSPEI